MDKKNIAILLSIMFGIWFVLFILTKKFLTHE